MKDMKVVSAVLVAGFLWMQVLVRAQYTQGPVCSPALTETGAGSHPMFEVTGYGFPRPVLEMVTNTCVEPFETSARIQPVGAALSALIAAGLAYPLWRRKKA